MDKEYWLDRWEQGDIGFHQSTINPYLQEYWHRLHLARGSEVLIPLCGKSRDMLWLLERGHDVLGVEFSQFAAEAFFSKNSLTPQRIPSDKFIHLEANGLRILCGDFFDLDKNDVAKNQCGLRSRSIDRIAIRKARALRSSFIEYFATACANFAHHAGLP